MKIITIIGARPQFIKAAAVSNELRKNHKEILIHTGQHYDSNMSQTFFEDLNIPTPDYNLGIGSGSHGKQTGRMLEKIEEIIIEEKPDMILVYGDTNSTLAGALAGSKLDILVAHVEAGLRSYNKKMPEEQNRILTDHISTLLLCPTSTAVENLNKEGINEGVFNVGDVMYDIALKNIKIAEETSNIMNKLSIKSKEYILSTVHRAENTDDISKLKNIFTAFIHIDKKIILPLHPRTKNIIYKNKEYFDFMKNKNIYIIDPLPYLDMLLLEKNAYCIMTDSGGIQKEAYFFETPCITLREQTEWVETLKNNYNILTGSDTKNIIDGYNKLKNIDYSKLIQEKYYGDGNAVQKIIKKIEGIILKR